MAIAGGTKDVIIADNTASLKSQLKAAISQIIAAKLSFTAPAITATIEKGGSLFQAQFDYQQNKEWNGTLTRTAIDSKGNIDPNDTWSAADLMPNPDARKIWTIIDADYKGVSNDAGTATVRKYNNFVEHPRKTIEGVYEFLGIPNFKHRFINLDQFQINGMGYDDAIVGEGLHTVKTDAIYKDTYDAYSIIPKSIIDKYKQCNFWKG